MLPTELPEQDASEDLQIEDRFREISNWLIFIGTGAFSTVFLAFLVFHSWGRDNWIVDIVKAHFLATVGLPLAAIASICVVFLFRFVSGEIEFEGFGLKFHGASAPLILWILAFMAMATAMKMVW